MTSSASASASAPAAAAAPAVASTSIYGVKTTPVNWELIMDLDVEAIQKGKAKLSRDLLTHVCQAEPPASEDGEGESDGSTQPEWTDSFHVTRLWRVTQLLLETSVYENSRLTGKLQESERRAKESTEAWERQKKDLLSELEQLKKENQFFKGEKPGIMPAGAAAATSTPATSSSSSSSSDEVKSLQDRVRKLQEQYTAMMKQKTAIQDELNKLKELNSKQPPAAPSKPTPEDSESTIEDLRKEVASLKVALDGRLAESVPFRNLKSMLAQKNNQLRDLRRRLLVYEPTEAGVEDSTTD